MADGPAGDLVISFCSVGHDAGRAPSPEFVATATGRGTAHSRRALFVMDESRSWATDPAFAPVLQAALDRTAAMAPVGRIATIGLSMGAFAALAAMQVLPVTAALAFGPQWSPLMPGESRWADWTARLSALPPAMAPSPPPCGLGPGVGGAAGKAPRLLAPLPNASQGWACLFHGLVDDQAQAMAFPLQKGTDHFLFPAQSHSSLVPHLKSRGLLAGLMEAALAGNRRRLIRLATSAGGMRRKA